MCVCVYVCVNIRISGASQERLQSSLSTSHMNRVYDDKRIVERYTRRLGHITRHPAVKPSSSSSCCHCASVGRINRPIVRGLTEKNDDHSSSSFFISLTVGQYLWLFYFLYYCTCTPIHPSCLDYFFFDGKFVFVFVFVFF